MPLQGKQNGPNWTRPGGEAITASGERSAKHLSTGKARSQRLGCCLAGLRSRPSLTRVRKP